MRGPLAWVKLWNRVERLKKFLALDPIAPRAVMVEEVKLIEAARDEWRVEHAEMVKLLKRVVGAVERIEPKLARDLWVAIRKGEEFER